MSRYLFSRPILLFGTLAIGASGVSCSSSSATPTAPSTTARQVSDTSLSSALRLSVASQSSSHGLPLTAFAGSGSGVVNVTPNARDGEFTLNTEDEINVHDVTPGTLLYVRAAADVGLPNGQQSDGTCQRAAAGQFNAVLLYPGGPPATIEISPDGGGAVHIEDHRNSPLLPPGGSADFMFRVVNALPPAVPSIDLRTECFTLQIK
jgi:hypothetical protein